MRPGYRQFCAISRTLDLLGQRWTLLVVRELALRGGLTAAAIARGLPDVPMNQLSERLALLEAQGIVEASREEDSSRVYELSADGRALEDVLAALARFGLERLAEPPAPGDAVLPHVLMRQLELRFEASEGLAGRFELTLTDPESLWSVEPGAPAPGRYCLVAGRDGLQARAGACLNADASLTMSVSACAGLIAGDPKVGVEVEVEGDRALAERLLQQLGASVSVQVAAAA